VKVATCTTEAGLLPVPPLGAAKAKLVVRATITRLMIVFLMFSTSKKWLERKWLERVYANFETEVLLLDEKVNSFLTANQITDVISITTIIFNETAIFASRGLIRTVTYRK
jgi:hypothetical protein